MTDFLLTIRESLRGLILLAPVYVPLAWLLAGRWR
jgi:hypothetical protein